MGINWETASTPDVMASVLVDQPQIDQHLAAAHDEAWRAVDPVLLELVRLRVAMLLDNQAELRTRTVAAVGAGLDEATVAELSLWPTSPRFGPTERACLDFAEQWVIDVASLSDDQAAAVSARLGDEGLAHFASALLVIEQRQRLRLAWTRLFGPQEAS